MSSDQHAGMLLRDRLVAQARAMANVHAVGLGGRLRGGDPTGELCLTVFVERKLPVGALATSDVLPAGVGDLPVDVVAMARPAPLSAFDKPLPGGLPPSEELGWRASADRTRHPHLSGGIQIMSTADRGAPGTLGCFLRDQHGDVYALTAEHVVAGPTSPPVVDRTRVGHPTAQRSVSNCCSHQFGTFAAGVHLEAGTEHIDVAAIRLDPGTVWAPEVVDVGPIRGIRELAWDDIRNGDYQVVKRGITTALTGGIVLAVGAVAAGPGEPTSPTVNTNDIVLRPNPSFIEPTLDLYFAWYGDSGSVVMNADNEIVAVLYAGAVETDPEMSDGLPPELGAGIATPITHCLVELNIASDLEFEVITVAPGADAEVSIVGDGPAATRSARARGPTIASRPEDDERKLGRDLAGSERGRSLVNLWLANQHELIDLVNHNKRVAAAWHRSGAGRLFQQAMQTVARPDEHVPIEIDGRPVEVVVDDFAKVLGRHASAELTEAVAEVIPIISIIAGHTYDAAIERLRDAS